MASSKNPKQASNHGADQSSGSLDELVSKNQEQENTLAELRQELGLVHEELQELKHSRLVSKAIKVRSRAGEYRKRAASYHPRAVAHATRVVVAPFIPAIIRKPLKRSLVNTRDRVRKFRTQVIEVYNAPWHDNKPLVSVVIPYANKGETVDDTIGSLVSQTFRNFEVVVVDDGSREKFSTDRLKKLQASGIRIKIIRQTNRGVSNARNRGIKVSRGKYIICLDSDDIIEPTYIEKTVIIAETNPEAAIVTTNVECFGVRNEIENKNPYNPRTLIIDNTVVTAALFQKRAWEKSGGYKPNIGYEDWEYWINLAEHGYWGKLLPEPIFKYRTLTQSRYSEDKGRHWQNLNLIRSMHPKYAKTIRQLHHKRLHIKHKLRQDSAFINLSSASDYLVDTNKKPKVLIALPWMTFGGAETLIFNFTNEIKADFNLAFVTGLESSHEWEFKFKTITDKIYHLPNLFKDQALYLDFISLYITTRKIELLHIIHTSFMFDMLGELKQRHPNLKIIMTVFNDRAEHFAGSVKAQKFIDSYSTDNTWVVDHYQRLLDESKPIQLIANGIDCYNKYNPTLFNRAEERSSLFLKDNELAVFFVGRLSKEKNPNVFLDVAKQLVDSRLDPPVKFFIIGDGQMRRQLEKKIQSIGSKAIQYLGYYPEVAKFLSAADVFILPSAIEGFPLSILEAMAMENVVIASNVGAVGEIVAEGETGYVVRPGSARDIARTVKAINADRSKLKTVGRAARQSVESRYSNVLLGNNYKKLYRDSLK